MRPSSILWFERLYLAAIVVGILNSLLAWESFAETQAALGMGFVVATLVISNGISLLLWYLVARRGSVVAKWVLVVLFALGVASLLFTLVMGTYPSGAVGVIGAVGWLLQAAAVMFLFRQDAALWFDGDDATDVEETFR